MVSAGLYVLSGEITYSARPGQLGPDFWPKLAIGLIAIVSIAEIARALISGAAEGGAQGVSDRLDQSHLEEAGADGAPPRTTILIAGIVLTLAYAAAVPVLGFIAASFAFVVIFMYLAGVRSHLTVWLVSVGGILAFAFIFIKVVYVSIPRGQPPFDQITQAVMDLLLVK